MVVVLIKSRIARKKQRREIREGGSERERERGIVLNYLNVRVFFILNY